MTPVKIQARWRVDRRWAAIAEALRGSTEVAGEVDTRAGESPIAPRVEQALELFPLLMAVGREDAVVHFREAAEGFGAGLGRGAEDAVDLHRLGLADDGDGVELEGGKIRH